MINTVQIISKGEATPKQGMWDSVIEFKLHLQDVGAHDDLEAIGEQRLHQVVDWIYNNFKENFILIEKVTVRIAGGYTNNKEQWTRHPEIPRDDYAWQGQYELRCHERDGNWFSMMFQ